MTTPPKKNNNNNNRNSTNNNSKALTTRARHLRIRVCNDENNRLVFTYLKKQNKQTASDFETTEKQKNLVSLWLPSSFSPFFSSSHRH